MKFKEWFDWQRARPEGLSQPELARRLAISQPHVSQLLSETGRPPSWVLMKRIKAISAGKVPLNGWDAYPTEYEPPEVA